MKQIMSLLVVAGSCVFLSGCQKTPASLEQWEYKVLSASELAGLTDPIPMNELLDREAKEFRETAALDTLNKLGSSGWALIAVEEDYFYFRRQL